MVVSIVGTIALLGRRVCKSRERRKRGKSRLEEREKRFLESVRIECSSLAAGVAVAGGLASGSGDRTRVRTHASG